MKFKVAARLFLRVSVQCSPVVGALELHKNGMDSLKASNASLLTNLYMFCFLFCYDLSG